MDDSVVIAGKRGYKGPNGNRKNTRKTFKMYLYNHSC